ncbi:hypothetical protein JKF63_04536 [Porcisia hertigi]|uniref:Uncharacterized protein n=1 Tax=Porcisia hertigi TaxID=2761500 RepID=A0A836I0R2_9TRYP|nr:hypothetical protein JKF63_04536 [Porcisia hertigi]
MSNFLKNLVYKTLVLEGSNMPLVQRMAAKAARMKRGFTGEKLGLWLGAAAREVCNDVSSSYRTARTYLSPDAAEQRQNSSTAEAKHPKSVGGGRTQPKP